MNRRGNLEAKPNGKGNCSEGGSGDIKAERAVKCCCEESSGEEAVPRLAYGTEKGTSDSSSQGWRKITEG